jgi:hypothetical protein
LEAASADRNKKRSSAIVPAVFAKGIQNLDSVYHHLEQDLGSHPNDELLLEAMLQNLQLADSDPEPPVRHHKKIKTKKERT